MPQRPAAENFVFGEFLFRTGEPVARGGFEAVVEVSVLVVVEKVPHAAVGEEQVAGVSVDGRESAVVLQSGVRPAGPPAGPSA